MIIKERFLLVLLSPHISEKASFLTEKKNTLTFKVLVNSTKKEIKDSIEKIFNTKVKMVNTILTKKKKKRGDKKSKANCKKKWKKAYVTLEKGCSLDIIDHLK